MRVAQAAATPAPSAGAPGSAAAEDAEANPNAAVAPAPGPRQGDRFATLPAGVDELSRQVVFRFQLGTQIDEGQLTGRPLASGEGLGAGHRNTRFFQLGDLALGTRGLVLTPLSTYLAAGFRFDQDGGLGGGASSTPSIFDTTTSAGGVLVRSGWAEVNGLPGPLGPLSVRAGRQYRYGLAVVHFDGATARWDGRAVTASLFAGRRVALYRAGREGGALGPTFDADAPDLADGPIAGGRVEFRLTRLTRAPLVLGVDVLRWAGTSSIETALRYLLSPDATLSLFARQSGGGLSRWGATFRARMSRVSTLSISLDHSLGADWAYDLVLRRPDDDRQARWLNLGIGTSEVRLAARAGTVLRQNLDLTGTMAASLPVGDTGDNVHQPPYVEFGGGVDGRFAYNVQVALLGRWRRFGRADAATTAEPGFTANPFTDVAAAGERTVGHGGVRLRYALGKRRFSSELEVAGGYLSYWRFVTLADARTVIQKERDGALNVRLRFEAWIGPRFRILADYEVFSADPEMPELIGLQRLRVVGEASF
jgi:hypothetical protein